MDDDSIGVNAKNTIYGNPEIFADNQRTVVDAETAVRVLNDKGSFVVGAKLLRNIDYLVLNYRWVAIKFPVGNDLGLVEDHSGQSISPETPTVRMGTKENHYFGDHPNYYFFRVNPTSQHFRRLIQLRIFCLSHLSLRNFWF